MPAGVKANREKIKREAPNLLKNNPGWHKYNVADHFKIERTTLWLIEKEDPEFKQAMKEAYEFQVQEEKKLVRNAWKKRLLKGEAAPSEYIYYISNKFPEEFQDRRATINNNFNASSTEIKDSTINMTPEEEKVLGDVLLRKYDKSRV